MELQFKHSHAQITAPFDLTGVRVSDNQAYALLGSKATPANYIALEHRGGEWKIGSLIGDALP
jgi:hypothetical protein